MKDSTIICRRCGQNVEDWRIVCDSAAHVAVREAHEAAEAEGRMGR